MTELEQRQLIVKTAKEWEKTPYHHMARVKGQGADCATFLLEVFEEAGLIPHIELEYYPPDWHLHQTRERYQEYLLQYCHKIETPPQPGDIALYKWGLTAAHGAIVIDYPTIIHSLINIGVTLYNDQVMRGKLLGFYSYWGNP